MEIKIQSLVPVNWRNQRVLTTAQIAERFGCPVDNIQRNFNRNRGQFIEGDDYFKLTGEELKSFRDYSETIRLILSNNTPCLYLWTAAGIFFHCKMLNTSLAWELFSKIGEALSSSAPFILEELVFGNITFPEKQPDIACVYALNFGDGIVKIGITKNLDERQNAICRDLQVNVIKSYHTPFMPRKKAFQIENACHKTFHDRLAYRREYFKITFEEACEEIDRQNNLLLSENIFCKTIE